MEILSWATVASSLDGSVPFVLPLGGSKGAQLVFDGPGRGMSIRLRCSDADQIPHIPLAHVRISKAKIADTNWLIIEITGLRSLQPVHQLGVLCATYLESGNTAASSIRKGLDDWAQLLERQQLLSPDVQLGLRGELALLQTLIAARGPSAIDSWTANNAVLAGRHDFRLNDIEIEVKSTRQRARRHHISSLQQLAPSPNRKLFILSLQYEQSGLGPGQTLPECVERIRAMLEPAPAALKSFEQNLALAKFRNLDAAHYDERLMLATQPMMISVTPELPALTPELLRQALPSAALQRLLSASYEIDFEGLGYAPTDPRFTAAIGQWIDF